ncbi:MAG: FxDxF family PEP-CTERM protein [Rhodoferax sp.]
MKSRRFFAAVALTLVGMSSAFAAGGNLGTLDSFHSTASNSFLGDLNTSFYVPVVPALSLNFSDVYTFSVNSAANFFVTGGFDGSVASGSLTLTGTGYVGPQSISWGGSPISLTSGGIYALTVSGTAGEFGGGYHGSIGNSVAAVPEPETVAMLLAGLGLIGMVTRRRNKAVAA